MSGEFTGKRVIVTGGSRGTRQAAAFGFAAAGVSLCALKGSASVGVFLASLGAAWITEQSIVVDGGQLIGP